MNIQFVLVETGSPGNLGAAARAIWTMGFDRLVLVRPRAKPDAKEALDLAVEAHFVLEKAKIFKTLDEALADSHRVVGTTRRKRHYQKEFVTPKQFAGWAQKIAPEEKISILFGTEDSGLSNEELSLCNFLVAIPANPKFASLNLAQAVQIVAYELFQGETADHAPSATEKKSEKKLAKLMPADMKQMNQMYEHLETALLQIGFLQKENPDHSMAILQSALNRACLTKQETQLIRGVCRQIQWYTEQGPGMKNK